MKASSCLPHRVFIGLGANLGARKKTLAAALARLQACPAIRLRRVSRLIETDPVGTESVQPRYLNGVAELATSLSPRQLLHLLLAIEKQLGRRRDAAERYAPRTIDLDLLLYDQRTINAADLVLPHPRLHERLFVLAPLAELAPNLRHPLKRRSIKELLAAQPRK